MPAKLQYLLPVYGVEQQAALKLPLKVLSCVAVHPTEVPAPGPAAEEDACAQEAANEAPGAGARVAERTGEAVIYSSCVIVAYVNLGTCPTPTSVRVYEGCDDIPRQVDLRLDCGAWLIGGLVFEMSSMILE